MEHAKRYKITFDCSKTRSDISLRLGVPFWGLITAMAEKGYSKTETAEFLGVCAAGFCRMMLVNPKLDPFPCQVSRQYLIDTGESVVSAARRLAAQGMHMEAAARHIGFTASNGLKQALEARGAVVAFPRIRAARRVKSERHLYGQLPTAGISRKDHPWRKAAAQGVAVAEEKRNAKQ